MKTSLTLMEYLATAVLIAVILTLGWIILAAWKFEWLRLASLQVEVVLVVGLLVAALALVSMVALCQTRGQQQLHAPRSLGRVDSHTE